MFFFVFVLGIAQSSITIKTYTDAKKAQDSSYKFTIFTLVFSIIGMLISGFMTYSALKGTSSVNANATAGSQTNVDNKLATKLENLAEQIKQKNI